MVSWTKSYGFLLLVFLFSCLFSGAYLGITVYPKVTQALQISSEKPENDKSIEVLSYLLPSLNSQFSLFDKTLHSAELKDEAAWLLMGFDYVHEQEPHLNVTYESALFKDQKDPLFTDLLQNKIHQKFLQTPPETGKSFEMTLSDLKQESTHPIFMVMGYFYEPMKARVLLIDPNQAFDYFQNLTAYLGRSRILLVDPEGSILYHSQTAFMGHKLPSHITTELKASEAVEKKYESIDQLKVESAMAAVENTSFTFLVETPETNKTFQWLSPENNPLYLEVGGIILVLLLFYFLLIILLHKKILKNVTRAIQSLQPPATPVEEVKQKPIEPVAAVKAGPVQVRYKEKILTAEKSNHKNIKFCEDLHALSQCPVLYFEFQKNTQKLKLNHFIGATVADKNMEFYLDTPTYQAILQCEKEKKIASLSLYSPLLDLIRNTMQADLPFEAWALTSPYSLHFNKEPEFIGAVLLFQKGFQNENQKKSFIKILRTAGTAYESTASKA